jgi:hypothetical protein
MLVRIITEIDPFGPDHAVLLEMLDAVRQLADDRVVPTVATVMGRSRFFGGKKARAFKTAAVQALVAIGTAPARAAIDQAKRSGDRVLRRVIRDLGA